MKQNYLEKYMAGFLLDSILELCGLGRKKNTEEKNRIKWVEPYILYISQVIRVSKWF